MERTLSIIKPDAVKRNIIGKVISKLEDAGLRIVAQKRTVITKEQAREFYDIHSDKPFYDGLCENMSAGPVVIQVLEGENAILKNREVMGATNPSDAAAGTIRKEFGLNIDHNTVHGSDSPDNATYEISFFFSQTEIIS